MSQIKLVSFQIVFLVQHVQDKTKILSLLSHETEKRRNSSEYRSCNFIMFDTYQIVADWFLADWARNKHSSSDQDFVNWPKFLFILFMLPTASHDSVRGSEIMRRTHIPEHVLWEGNSTQICSCYLVWVWLWDPARGRRSVRQSRNISAKYKIWI